MLKIEATNQFKRDFRLAMKRGCNPADFKKVVDMLSNEIPLPEKYQDHLLISSKNYKDVRECHISPDWLLVYRIEKATLLLQLIRTGTHSDLF
jgi:mRNA interferase YafQ